MAEARRVSDNTIVYLFAETNEEAVRVDAQLSQPESYIKTWRKFLNHKEQDGTWNHFDLAYGALNLYCRENGLRFDALTPVAESPNEMPTKIYGEKIGRKISVWEQHDN